MVHRTKRNGLQCRRKLGELGTTVSKQSVLHQLQDWKDKSAKDNKYVTADKVKSLVTDLKAIGIDPSSSDVYIDVRTLFDQAPENLLAQINKGGPTEAINKQWSSALDDLIGQVSRAEQSAPVLDTPAAKPGDATTGAGTVGGAAPATSGEAQAPPATGPVPDNPSTNNPGFPSGTPVPGSGNTSMPAASLDAIPADSDYRKMLQACEPTNVDGPASSGEHGQLHHTNKTDTTSTNTELAAKSNSSAISVNGGTQMAVVGKNNQVQLFDATTGKNMSDSLPFFAKSDTPSGTVIFGDGTRLDLKANDGATFVSGNTVTTVNNGEVSSTDGAPAAQSYLQNNARNRWKPAANTAAWTSGALPGAPARWLVTCPSSVSRASASSSRSSLIANDASPPRGRFSWLAAASVHA